MAHLSEAAVAKINEICDRYVSEKTPLIMILSDIQKEYGYIPLEVQEIVSQRTGISVAEIYGVVTFSLAHDVCTKMSERLFIPEDEYDEENMSDEDIVYNTFD